MYYMNMIKPLLLQKAFNPCQPGSDKQKKKTSYECSSSLWWWWHLVFGMFFC